LKYVITIKTSRNVLSLDFNWLGNLGNCKLIMLDFNWRWYVEFNGQHLILHLSILPQDLDQAIDPKLTLSTLIFFLIQILIQNFQAFVCKINKTPKVSTGISNSSPSIKKTINFYKSSPHGYKMHPFNFCFFLFKFQILWALVLKIHWPSKGPIGSFKKTFQFP